MKVLNFKLFGVLALAGTMFLGACSNDDDDNGEPKVKKANIQFVGSGKYTSDDATVDVGDTINFKWIIQKGDNNLKKFTLTGGQQGGVIFDTSELDAEKYTDEISIVMSQSGDHQYTFQVWDTKDNKKSKSITITVRKNQQLKQDSAILMGAQDNADYGSFYSTSESKTYFASGFDKSNAPKIDFIYYYGSTNNATIAAPSDATVEEFKSTFNVQSWDQRNKTTFLSINKAYANINKEGDIVQYQGTLSSSNTTKANQLSSGEVYAYQTESGKLGVMKVKKINNKTSGFIKINVKIQP